MAITNMNYENDYFDSVSTKNKSTKFVKRSHEKLTSIEKRKEKMSRKKMGKLVFNKINSREKRKMNEYMNF